MAYQIGRAKNVSEILELVDDNGAVVQSIPVDLDVDRIAAEFNRRYNDVIRAERIVKAIPSASEGEVAMTQEQADAANAALAAFGAAVISLFELVFGNVGAKTILDFFEGKYFEMSCQVVPFIVNVVVPAIKQSTEARQRQLADEYKLNRTQRRRMGL